MYRDVGLDLDGIRYWLCPNAMSEPWENEIKSRGGEGKELS